MEQHGRATIFRVDKRSRDDWPGERGGVDPHGDEASDDRTGRVLREDE
jgi:hypothetical protein